MPSLISGGVFLFKGYKMITKNPKKQTWQDKRINEINKISVFYSPNNEYFEEVYAIYDSKAKSYKQFKKDFINNGGVICTK